MNVPTTIRCRTALPYPPGRVWELLADPVVIEGRTSRHDGLDAVVLAHRVEGAGWLRIDTKGTMPTSWLPPILAGRATGRMPSVNRQETWQRTSAHGLDGWMTFTIHGVDAASADGWMRVRTTDRGGELQQEVTIAVQWPLFGGLIERSLAGRIHESLAAEGRYLADQ